MKQIAKLIIPLKISHLIFINITQMSRSHSNIVTEGKSTKSPIGTQGPTILPRIGGELIKYFCYQTQKKN